MDSSSRKLNLNFIRRERINQNSEWKYAKSDWNDYNFEIRD